MYGYFEMKFALGAAAAITGASALIYLLLRPRKRQLDPGKQKVPVSGLNALKDTHNDNATPVTEEYIVQNKSENREHDPNSVNGDHAGFQNFNGHISVEDTSCNSGHEDAKCKISLIERDFSIDDDISKEKVPSQECVTTKEVDSSLPCSTDDNLCDATLVDSNDEVCAAVQNTVTECPASFVKQTSEEALQSVGRTGIQEGIISSTGECEISECVSASPNSEQKAPNVDCDRFAADSHVTSSSFSEEKECALVMDDLIKPNYSLPLHEECQQENCSSLEKEPVTSSGAAENESESAVSNCDIGKDLISVNQLSEDEDLQKENDLELEKKLEVSESDPSVVMEIKKLAEISRDEVPVESCIVEDSIATKSSFTTNYKKDEAELLATGVPASEALFNAPEVEATTELPDKKVTEADVLQKTSVPIESSEIKTVKESDVEGLLTLARDEPGNGQTSDTELCSQSEKAQSNSAQVNINAAEKSSTDSKHIEVDESNKFVTSIMSKEEEPAYDLKSKSMWSECAESSPRNSVTEEAFSIVCTDEETVSSKEEEDNSEEKKKKDCKISKLECDEKKALVLNVDLGEKDEEISSVDQKTDIKTDVNSVSSSVQELSDVPESGSGKPCAQETISLVVKEDSPPSVGNSQRKKSYKDRVRNSNGSTSTSSSDSIPKEKVSEESTCLNQDQIEKELCSVIEDTHDNSVSSFVVKEKIVTPSDNKVVESVSSSPPVREIVIVDNKVSNTPTKKESSQSKSSKSKKEGPPKPSDNSKNRSYRDRVRNARGNSVSETVQNSQEDDQNSDNNGRNLKSTESSQSSNSEVGPDTLFNPSAFPVSSQVQYIFYEFEIPQVLVGRLIGRKGAFVNKIKAATDATIVVGPHKNRRYKICSVEGSREQVDLALDMIREYFPLSRFPDLTLEQVFNRSPSAAPPVETTINSPAMQQIELAAGVVVEVRVSAVVSGNELWVQQPLHPSYSALQRLQSCMNINYGNGSTTPPLASHIREGIICVAQINSQWYRCQVLSTSEDFALIVLLDVGGTVSIPPSELRQIRRDYMTLPFQAAQCLLHGIQPVSEEGWDETSAVVLEELVSGAILFATVVSYTPDGVPLVNLYRRDQDEYVYLNERLVNLGHAQWISPPTST